MKGCREDIRPRGCAQGLQHGCGRRDLEMTIVSGSDPGASHTLCKSQRHLDIWTLKAWTPERKSLHERLPLASSSGLGRREANLWGQR